MKKVGIYGGSFNPIHLGHTGLATWILDQEMVDEVWMMVSPQNPLKPSAGLMPDDLRLHLTEIAIASLTPHYGSRLRACDFEMHLPRPSYMVHTLEHLRATYPDNEFVLIIGADNWTRFPQWYRSEEIMRHHRLLVYPRPGSPFNETTSNHTEGHIKSTDIATQEPPQITFLQSPLFDISSSEIRRRIIQDTSYKGEGLDKNVWDALSEEIKKLRELWQQTSQPA